MSSTRIILYSKFEFDIFNIMGESYLSCSISLRINNFAIKIFKFTTGYLNFYDNDQVIIFIKELKILSKDMNKSTVFNIYYIYIDNNLILNNVVFRR